VRRKLVQEMKAAGPLKLPPLDTRAQVEAEVVKVIDSGDLNPQATPGVPLDRVGRTKRKLLEEYRSILITSAVDLIQNWKVIGLDKIKQLSIRQLLELQLVYPTMAKIKQEPHSKEKLEQQRYRIFFAVSVIHELATRVLYQSVVKHEANQWRTLPVKPGVGFTDEMMSDLFVDINRRTVGTAENNDGSGYDWSQRQWIIDLVTEATREAYDIDATRYELMRIDVLLSYKTPWMLSDGRLLEVYIEGDLGKEWIVWKSGRFTTARDNSWGRISLAHMGALRLGRLDESWACTMGDDCVESDLGRDYAQFGVRITDRQVTRKDEPFTFCSRVIQKDGCGKLIPWAKSLYRLLSKRPDWEFVYQFEHELRHNPEIKKIEDLLWKIGYYKTLGFVSHCQTLGICALPQNSIMKGQVPKPKGMPKAEWAAMSKKAKARFLDFNIKTSQYNTGTQQYGAGQSLRSRSIAKTVVLAKPKTRSVQPGLVNGKDPIISETEMIGTVTVPDSGYHVTNQYTVQPALPLDENSTTGGCFNFIVPMAQLYEKYELMKLSFTYKPLVSVFADGGKAGQVVLSYSYDALSGAPQDIITALATQPHVEGMANQAFTLNVNCREAMAGGKYTRASVVPATDIKTYDAGRLFICVDGVPVTAGTIGQLIVQYTVRLLNPRPGGVVSTPPNYAFSTYNSYHPLAYSGTTVPTKFVPDGTIVGTNPLGVRQGVSPGGSITFQLPKGCWLIVAKCWALNTGNGGRVIMSMWASTDNNVTYTEAVSTIQTGYTDSANTPASACSVFAWHQENDQQWMAINASWTTLSVIGNESTSMTVEFYAA